MDDTLEHLKIALANRYRVERELGRGGMATVYLAEDLKHHRKVAIKVLRPELAASLGPERFLREIEIAAQLTHPYILPVHDSGNAAGLLFYVMPYVEGESLRDRMSRERQLPLEEAVQIAHELADGLAYAHGRGVVHRDIKPENVLLAGGHAVISDFGIALLTTQADSERLTQLTQAGALVGTPTHMSPEQAQGGDFVDARSDVYSLGSVLYEMLAGEPPFLGSTPQTVLTRKLTQPPPRLRTVRPTVSEGLEAVILKALATAPADRFSTCAEFRDSLRTATTSEAMPLPTSQAWLRPRAAAVVLVVLLCGAGLTWTAWHYGPLGQTGAESAAVEGKLRVLSADPLPGTTISAAELEKPFRVHLVVEHSIGGWQGDLSPVVRLMVLVRRDVNGKNDEGIWRVLDARRATWETRQLGLTGYVRTTDVVDNRITLRVAIMFEDSDGTATLGPMGSTLVEYPVNGR